MATKEKKSVLVENNVEDPALLVSDETTTPKPGTMKTDPKDMRIAELEKRLAEAEKLNKAMAAGDDYSIVKQETERCARENIDPFTVWVEIRVPVRTDCNDKYYWGCVNGQSVQIPANNEYQKMKLPFAEMIVNMIRNQKHADTFADEEVKTYDPVTNPHPDPNK